MLFNSFEFALFFPLVTAGYFVLPHRHRWWWLLAASSYFYMAFVPVYILILAFTIAVDYVAGLLIEGSQGAARRFWLIASILANCGVLAVFKYFNFLTDSFGLPYHLDILLPIGLSFHTFQSLSYTIEVYRGKQTAERHLGIFALYVMFYPQLVAGPIERPQNLLHQFREPHTFDYDRVTDGLKLMAWGLFKKVVVADRLAQVVDRVYDDPTAFTGPALVFATLCFAYQIYCDFSGYSDIALGCAQVMGFTLMENFRRPYYARSIGEFWRRWHISLSTWFKDYLYIPLGGNRTGYARWQRNLLITFMVSGLWHGANWTFVVWGALHGTYLVLGNLTARVRPAAPAWLQRLVTFLLVCLAWVFFRARTVEDALYILGHMGSGWSLSAWRALGLLPRNLLIMALAWLLLELVQAGQERFRVRSWVRRQPTVVRWVLYYAVALILIALGVYNRSQFIYFQF